MFHCIYYDNGVESSLYRSSGIDYVMMSTEFLGMHLKKAYTLDEIARVVNEEQLDVVALLNRFYYEEDLEELKRTIIKLDEIGVHRLMFSDFGVLDIVQSLGLPFYCICQTDTTMTSSRDINQMFEYGASECVIARELTFDEINYIVESAHGMIGVHFFGYPLMSTSRKQHLRNYFEFVDKSVNLSEVVWLKEKSRDEYYLSVEDVHGNSTYYGHIVSPYQDIDRLNRSNVTLYYDTIGLETRDVLYFASMIVQKFENTVIEKNMLDRGIVINRGLLDQASVLRKDTK